MDKRIWYKSEGYRIPRILFGCVETWTFLLNFYHFFFNSFQINKYSQYPQLGNKKRFKFYSYVDYSLVWYPLITHACVPTFEKRE